MEFRVFRRKTSRDRTRKRERNRTENREEEEGEVSNQEGLQNRGRGTCLHHLTSPPPRCNNQPHLALHQLSPSIPSFPPCHPCTASLTEPKPVDRFRVRSTELCVVLPFSCHHSHLHIIPCYRLPCVAAFTPPQYPPSLPSSCLLAISHPDFTFVAFPPCLPFSALHHACTHSAPPCIRLARPWPSILYHSTFISSSALSLPGLIPSSASPSPFSLPPRHSPVSPSCTPLILPTSTSPFTPSLPRPVAAPLAFAHLSSFLASS